MRLGGYWRARTCAPLSPTIRVYSSASVSPSLPNTNTRAHSSSPSRRAVAHGQEPGETRDTGFAADYGSVAVLRRRQPTDATLHEHMGGRPIRRQGAQDLLDHHHDGTGDVSHDDPMLAESSIRTTSPCPLANAISRGVTPV